MSTHEHIEASTKPVVAESDSATAVASYLRDRIGKGQLLPGDRIPSERDLAVRFGCARSRVRQALQQLKMQGYLVSGRGRAGTIVASLDDLAATWSFKGLLVEQAGHLADLLEFSLGIEVEAAGLAATRRLPEDLMALDKILRDMAEQSDRLSPDLDVAFHMAIVQAAHNVFYTALIGELRQILRENMPLILDTLFRDPANAQVVLAQHSAIVTAIRDRDAHRARDANHQHLEWVFREIYRIQRQNGDCSASSEEQPVAPR